MFEIQLKSLTTCPLCSARQRKRLYVIEKTAVYRCQSCGLSYLDPCLGSEGMASIYQSSETLKKLHGFHDGYYEYGNLTKNSKTLRDFSRCLDLLEKHTQSQDKKIFEVGFGNGLFLALAEKRGWKVSGIDTSEKNVELAKSKFNLNLQNGFFEKMNESEGKFDVIAMLDIIEHQENPHDLIRKSYQMLRENGLLVLATPNDASLLRRLASAAFTLSGGRFHFGIKKVYFLEHVAYFNKKTLEFLLRENNFELIELFYTNTDLAKYHLNFFERCLAETILFLGRLVKMQNRLVMIGRKRS